MGKRWTFQDRATSMRRQLDYILAAPEGPQERPRARPDWEAFAGSPELQANYTAEVRGRLHLLAEEGSQQPTSGSSPPAKRQPGNGYRRRGDIEPPLGPNTRRLCGADTGGRGTRSFEREGTAESQEELNGAKQQLFSTYDRIKGEELMEKVKKVETVHGERRYKESWKVINEMSGRKRSRRDSWQAAAQRRGYGVCHSEVHPERRKSAGPDGIPPEVPKNCDLDDIILEICNQALMENIKPDIWSLANIIPVPKS
ncbi:hypothetical protein AAFF_G00216620 [Aldrovandia affinis]|uniref:Reverse transcriptase domain-containing protein n=1 Tax=Aldrovandia affinis TaxID=143900 RepID=A0AAD7RG59_9TELE|nr:hypothetical protein AAFF_G00216620 [Aldrovandia affinis]